MNPLLANTTSNALSDDKATANATSNALFDDKATANTTSNALSDDKATANTTSNALFDDKATANTTSNALFDDKATAKRAEGLDGGGDSEQRGQGVEDPLRGVGQSPRDFEVCGSPASVENVGEALTNGAM